MDLMACEDISKGNAGYKRKRKRMGFKEMLSVR